MTPPFIIHALPRSRTFWLSRLLSHGGWYCGHDELRHMRSLDDVRAWFSQPLTGTVETASAPWWRLVPGHVRQVVVRRPVADVVASLVRLGFDPAIEPLMRRHDAKLAQIEKRVPGALSVGFADLATEDGCRRVWEHCLPQPFDREWWERLAALNLQADVAAFVRYARAFKPQTDQLIDVARAQVLADMERRALRQIDGITFQQEPFASFFVDGEHLIARHVSGMGKGDHRAMNLPMLRMLNQTGAMEITTARSNGRMFGYVMTTVGPSMDDPDRVTATHATTYADPSVPGLGLRLMRAANDALQRRGVTEVLYRVGANQKKLPALYRRMGAVHCGEEYMLRLH